jgi:Spy/CpxP family protein refolding chaperone
VSNLHRKLGPALALAGTLVAGSVAAQQHGQGMGQMGGMMPGMEGQMGQMAAVHAYSPATLLAQGSDLAITKDQVAKLEALAAETKAGNEKARGTHDAHHAMLVELFAQAAPSPAQVSEHGKAAMTAMADAHVAELAACARAKGLLTPEQRAKVEESSDHAMHMGTP